MSSVTFVHEAHCQSKYAYQRIMKDLDQKLAKHPKWSQVRTRWVQKLVKQPRPELAPELPPPSPPIDPENEFEQPPHAATHVLLAQVKSIQHQKNDWKIELAHGVLVDTRTGDETLWKGVHTE